MNFRPRRPRFSKQQWEVQRERFRIDEETPAPVDEHISDLKKPVANLMASLGLRTDTVQQRLMNQWAAIAGQPLCRHIRPGPLENNVLTVYVSNSTMLTELTRFQGPALLRNLQAAVGANEVKRLRFLIDPDTRAQRYG